MDGADIFCVGLPYQWLHEFMKNAFLAILLVTPLLGLLSTMVVNNHMAFFSDSLGHGAFTGIAGGIAGRNCRWRHCCSFQLSFALFITYIKSKSRTSTDTIIGVCSSTAIACRADGNVLWRGVQQVFFLS